MSANDACTKCGELLHTGEGRVPVGLTANELAELAISATNLAVRARLVCAMGMLDPEMADGLKEAWRE